jgi:hypothetical protein
LLELDGCGWWVVGGAECNNNSIVILRAWYLDGSESWMGERVASGCASKFSLVLHWSRPTVKFLQQDLR